MNLLEKVQWFIWGLLLVYVLLQTLGHYNNAVKQGKPFHKAIPVLIYFGWFLIILFAFSDINKFHILWVYPLAFFLIVHTTMQRAIVKAEYELENMTSLKEQGIITKEEFKKKKKDLGRSLGKN